MKQAKNRKMTHDQLVGRFVEISLAQDLALLRSEISKFNRLFDRLMSVESELKFRSGDQRELLLKLFTHPNTQVRLNAAKATLAVAYNKARAQLQAIADSREYPQAGDAGMCLVNLDRGIFKPT